MKLTDYVVQSLVDAGIKHAFVVTGGASIHLLHSLDGNPAIEYICPHHEQSGAMAADAAARVTGRIGCAIATSGPGATNMITGIAGAWFDSVPVIYITGQVTTFRMKGESGVRQFGFQETEILPMARPITKYCAQLQAPENIRYELEKAVYMATSGRPGPVLLDLPDDLQRADIDPETLEGFVPETDAVAAPPPSLRDEVNAIIALLADAKRPVLVYGWGVRLAGADALAVELAERLGIPVLTSWGGRDLVDANQVHFAGTFGTHGTRSGNFAVQNSDLVIAVGARLSTRETGSPLSSFAREARLVVVDIDPAELGKFPAFDKRVDLAIACDAKYFMEAFLRETNIGPNGDISPWIRQIDDWKSRYPVCDDRARAEDTVNPYALVETLSEMCPPEISIFSDTGCCIAWLMQGFKVKRGQRIYHDYNNTAMGWALPAAIGGSLALGKTPVVCFVGDGSFMMNLQELATVAHLGLPVKIILINNGGYAMVRQTEKQWLDGHHVGTSVASGLGFPDFCSLADSFTIPSMRVEHAADVAETLGKALSDVGPVLVEIVMPQHHDVAPQSKFGYPIEDADPLLPRSEFLAQMHVAPMPKSVEPLDE